MKDINCRPCILEIHHLPELKTSYHHSPCKTADSIMLNNANGYLYGLVPLPVFRDLREEKKAILVSKIKNLIIDLICSSAEQLEVNFSQYLSVQLNHEYAYLSLLFSKDQGITIERFMIEQKIELVKDLLLSDKLTITKIALNMNYSSVGHLSNQFKKITGLSPSQFKKYPQ